MGPLARAAVLTLAVFVAGGCATLRHGLRGTPGFETPVEMPADAPALGQFLRGQVALNQNDYDTALDAFERAVAEDPNTPLLRLRLAGLYVRAGELNKALEQCQIAVEADPDNPEGLALYAGI